MSNDNFKTISRREYERKIIRRYNMLYPNGYEYEGKVYDATELAMLALKERHWVDVVWKHFVEFGIFRPENFDDGDGDDYVELFGDFFSMKIMVDYLFDANFDSEEFMEELKEAAWSRFEYYEEYLDWEGNAVRGRRYNEDECIKQFEQLKKDVYDEYIYYYMSTYIK